MFRNNCCVCYHKHWVSSFRQMEDSKTNFVVMVIEVFYALYLLP